MDFDSFFRRRFSDWQEIEKEIEKVSSPKDKGDLFEHFVYYFFVYFKDLYQIKEIFCPIVDRKPFPSFVIEKLKLENKDYGVDGVYISEGGKFIAWQAKFRSGRVAPTFTELSTFWAEAEYADYRLIISNSLYLPKVSKKKEGHLSILFDQFERLEADYFEHMVGFFGPEKPGTVQIEKKRPRDYQEDILQDILKGFGDVDRGKLIAACGIGKTLISLWTKERLNAKFVVFFAPSIQLVRQTLQQWILESNSKFRYLCICSDYTVNSDLDFNDIDLEDLDIPVTTDPGEISMFIKEPLNSSYVIFCTYQSSLVLHEALRLAEFEKFDLAIYDEAHRTAGVSLSNLFGAAVMDRIVPAARKLFMTATERLVRPFISSKFEESGRTVFSMDDKALYGPVFHSLSFGQAIEKGIISDYRIVFATVKNIELRKLLDANRIVTEDIGLHQAEPIQYLYKKKILEQVLFEYSLQKVITFHSKINEAKRFAHDLKPKFEKGSIYVDHINGEMSSQTRANIIETFKTSGLGILTNVRCLTEGIDIPIIDAVFFADPKGSLVDIIQAVGRTLRQPYGEKGRLAYIIIPFMFDRDEDMGGDFGFEALFNLIQALRDQDEKLAEWIDGINLNAAKGKISSAKSLGKIVINLPTELDYEEFANSLILKIADVNRDPSHTVGIGSKLKKNERKGSFARIFKTICDYIPETLESSLVKPTFDLIKDTGKLYSRNELAINNNNISHCERLGMIKKTQEREFKITQIGKIYKDNPNSFEKILKNQMLLFGYEYENGVLYPYRLAFEYMKIVKEMNFIEFIYGLYSIQLTLDGAPDILSAIDIAKMVRVEFPNIELTNEANKSEVLVQLNQFHNVGFSFENVWTDRTTTGNQFRYLCRHLEIFSDLFHFENGKLKLIIGAEERVGNILNETLPLIGEKYYGEKYWIL